MLPVKLITMPITCCLLIFKWKKNIPTSITKIGVSEFSVPAKELSSRVSARQKRKDGKKLPSNPVSMIYPVFSFGTFLRVDHAKGNVMMPAEKSLSAATCQGFNFSSPISISRKLLPQINDSSTNKPHLTREWFDFITAAKVQNAVQMRIK